MLAQHAPHEAAQIRPRALAQRPVDGDVAPHDIRQLARNRAECRFARDRRRGVAGRQRVVEGEFLVRQAEFRAARVRLPHIARERNELLDDLRRLHRAVAVAFERPLQHFRERPGAHDIRAPPLRQFPGQQFAQQLHGEMAPRHPAHLGEKLVRQDRNVGLLQSRRREDIDHPVRRHGARHDPAQGAVQFLFGPLLARRPLGEAGRYGLEERHVVADGERVLMRRGKRKRPDQFARRARQALLSVRQGEDVFLRRRQQGEALGRRFRRPGGAVETVEQAGADLVFLAHDRHGFGLVEGGAAFAAALGIGRERRPELARKAEIVHDETAGLVREHAVDAGDGLHQPVAAHRLVEIERVQARRVEPGEPHVAHQHDAERVRGVAEAPRQLLPPRLVADVLPPLRRVRRGAGHDNLHAAVGVAVAAPVRAQARKLTVEIDADAPAHADDHRLAVHRVEPRLEMRHDIARDEGEAPFRADHGLQLRPAGLEAFLARDLLALGRLLEIRVDPGPPLRVEPEAGEAAFVIDRHRGAVLDRAPDIVDADIVAEDRAGVRIAPFDGRAGEADERGVRQRVAHVARIAVDEVVLPAMRLVGDDDDIAAFGERRMPAAGPVGEEFLDGGEHHAARRDGEFRAQVGAVSRLFRRLTEEVRTPREGGEQLVVEVVAVGQHDDGGVSHRRVACDAACVERHRQALARALRVPDHADAPVAGRAAGPAPRFVAAGGRLGHTAAAALQRRRAPGLGDRRAHRVKLVVAGDLLGRRAARILEGDEAPEQFEEAALFERAFDEHPQFGVEGRRQLLALDSAPGLEPFEAGSERSEPRAHAVRDRQHRVMNEERRRFRLAGLQLAQGRREGGALVGGALELEDGERQPVDEDDDIGAAFVAVLPNGELVDGDPVVRVRIVEIHDLRLRVARFAGPVAVCDGDSLDDHAVGGAVARLERASLRPEEGPRRGVQRFVGKIGVEFRERVAEGLGKHRVRMAFAPAAGSAHGKFGSGDDPVVQPPEPVERGVLNHRFGQWRHDAAPSARVSICASQRLKWRHSARIRSRPMRWDTARP